MDIAAIWLAAARHDGRAESVRTRCDLRPGVRARDFHCQARPTIRRVYQSPRNVFQFRISKHDQTCRVSGQRSALARTEAVSIFRILPCTNNVFGGHCHNLLSFCLRHLRCFGETLVSIADWHRFEQSWTLSHALRQKGNGAVPLRIFGISSTLQFVGEPFTNGLKCDRTLRWERPLLQKERRSSAWR